MRIVFFLPLLLIFSFFSAPDLVAQTGAAKGTGRVKIKVTDAKGKALENVTIQFVNPEKEAKFEVTTDAKGEKTINGVTGGTWNIDFIKEGYLTKQISAQISQLNFNKPIELSLEEAVKTGATGQAAGKPDAPGVAMIKEGDLLKEKGDRAGAIAKYEEAARLNPDLYRVYADIGDLYLASDQKQKALEAFNTFLLKEPTNALVRIAAGQTLVEMKNLEEAKKMLTSADLSRVTNANSLYNLGSAFYNAKDTQEAIRYWEGAVVIDPSLVDAHFQLGLAYYATNQYDKAKEKLKKVIELDSGSESAIMAKELLDTMQ